MTPALQLFFEPQTQPHELRVAVAAGNRRIGEAWFRCRSGHSLMANADALFALGLYPASEIGSALGLAGEVDPDLFARSNQITGIFRDWWPDCRQVEVSARTRPATATTMEQGAALFFSGGIDSSFSLLEAGPQLCALVTLLGVDVPLSDPVACAQLERTCHNIAQRRGMDAIVIETNVREVFHPFAGWIEHHGAVMAAIGHMLCENVGRIFISASGIENEDTAWDSPWGSHPALDPLYSSALLAVEHYGLVSRFDKIARILKDDDLMRHLRICNQERKNCGRCDKCTFAMRSFEILRAGERAVTFPPLSPRRGQLKIVDDGFLSEMERLRAAAAEAGPEDMLPELDGVIGAYRGRATWLRLIRRRAHNFLRVARHRRRWERKSR
jgi:hypothetical protein